MYSVPVVCSWVRTNVSKEKTGGVLSAHLLTVLYIWRVDGCNVRSWEIYILPKRPITRWYTNKQMLSRARYEIEGQLLYCEYYTLTWRVTTHTEQQH